MLEAIAIIIGYLLGSFPTAYLVGRITRGIDIRKIGGGNMGALNSLRELGWKAGLVVLIIDIAKGVAAILITGILDVAQIWVYFSGFAAVVGHCWPVFLKFRGGKGAATTLGIFFALAPVPFACSLPVLLVIILVTSNVTLGMAGSMLIFPLFMWIFGHGSPPILFVILMAVFLAIRYVPTARRTWKKAGNWRAFIFEKNYKPWQTPRNKPPTKSN
jgi:glycerol-3-phosphate acyltransferase PlsY